MRASLSGLVLLAVARCSSSPGPGAGQPIDPAALGLVAHCPGAAGCLSGQGELYAGAAAVVISPTKYELPRVAYLGEEGFCSQPTPAAPFGLKRCGSLESAAMGGRKDCGLDNLCPGDSIKTRIPCDAATPCPHPALTCSTADKRCLLVYSQPDEDGSEKDGQEDWFLDCGRDRICPCLDKDGQPAYYGPDKKSCLKGHAPNPGYQAPDADGTEGDGRFQPMWMGGFGENRPLLGHHDDLWARALVLRTGDVTVAILALDTVGFFYDAVLKVRESVASRAKQHGIDYVLVSSTHTHEGPDTMGQWGLYRGGAPAESGVNQEHFAAIIEGATQAIAKAADGMQRATLSVGTVMTGSKNLVSDGADPRVYDDELVALKLEEAAGGKPIATVVSWAAHPETLSDTNNFLTSDFVHYLREALEKPVPKEGPAPELPAVGGVAIYLQGALGAMQTTLDVDGLGRDGTIYKPDDFGKARAIGIGVALKARQALEKAERLAEAPLAVYAKELLLPVENTAFQMAMNLNLFDRQTYGYNKSLPIDQSNLPKVKTEIGIVRLGPVSFYTLPGEPPPEVVVGGYDGSRTNGEPLLMPGNPNPPDLSQAPKGPYLKSKIPGKYKVTMGLANDELGYILPAYNFKLGEPPYFQQPKGDHYEETNSLGPQTEPLLQQAYSELLTHATK